MVLWDTPGIHSDRSRMLNGARRGGNKIPDLAWTSLYKYGIIGAWEAGCNQLTYIGCTQG